MIKYVPLVIILFSFISAGTLTNVNQIQAWVFSKQGTVYETTKSGKHLFVWWLTEKNSKRIAVVVIKLCKKYNKNPEYILKQAWWESKLRWWIINRKCSDVYGIMQVRLKYHSNLLSVVQNGRWKKVIENSSHKNFIYIQLSKRIDVGFEMGIILMDYLEKKYKNYPLALVAYWAGEYSDEFKKAKININYLNNLNYIKKILKG